jgi:Domain of unknown function (DUF1998)
MRRIPMASSPVRRAQLIAPFGVGSMLVAKGGDALLCGSLDHWFQQGTRAQPIEEDEFKVREWRLEPLLGVSHFRLPPDFRTKAPWSQESRNTYVTVPFFRFPQWHVCPKCHLLRKYPLNLSVSVPCPECSQRTGTKPPRMVQVSFVAVCDAGHLDDFPWREWVHRSAHPACDCDIRLRATGGATLAAQKIRCDCGKAERSLAGVTNATMRDGEESTVLSEELDDTAERFLCGGKMPWTGGEHAAGCGRPLRAALRSASNVYYADVRSAIYLPRSLPSVPNALAELLRQPPFSTQISFLRASGEDPRPEHLRRFRPELVADFSDEELSVALADVQAGAEQVSDAPDDSGFECLRVAEHAALRSERDEVELRVRAANVSEYQPPVAGAFDRVMLVERLRETRVLSGFTRILPENDMTSRERQALLWNRRPRPSESWLPAYQVFGEGLFLEFDETRLREWEARPTVAARVELLAEHQASAELRRNLRHRDISARLLLVHTFSHLVMNQLTFECGYSTSALRERLYVAPPDDASAGMAAVLIYTAAGDAEGTMGGLVRMGATGHLEGILIQALENAGWCSADPVCSEVGREAGQGPDSLNLAACHNCALVPETACEEFNRFLDRAAVVGDPDDATLGFFA